MIINFLQGATQTTRTSLTIYPLRRTSKKALFQVTDDTATTWDISVEGRLSSDFPWLVLNAIDETATAAQMGFEVTQYPEMRVVLTNQTGTPGTGISVSAELDAPTQR